MIGTVVIAGIVGYLAERSNFTHNGIPQSILICVGDAFLFYFVRLMLGIGFGSTGLNAILSSIGALAAIPTHWRKQDRLFLWFERGHTSICQSISAFIFWMTSVALNPFPRYIVL